METKYINKRIPIPSKKGLDFVFVNHIIYCEADGNYTRLFLINDRSILTSKPIKWFMTQLSGSSNFCRIHNSYIVNTDYVEQYIRGDGGQVKMVDEKYLSVSRARKRDLLQLLNRVPGN